MLCNIQSVLKKKISPIEITTSWQIHWHASSLTWIAGIGIVIRYKHNLIHTFIQSLNPIWKTLKFKRLQIRHKTRNQLTTKAQSFPRKSSKTASPMTARHAREFKWNWGWSSNFLPLTHGYQIPHPVEDSDNQIPSSPGRQRCQMPGVFREGGMLKLRFDRYITRSQTRTGLLPFTPPPSPQKEKQKKTKKKNKTKKRRHTVCPLNLHYWNSILCSNSQTLYTEGLECPRRRHH